jgi:hypothetical protein
VYKALAPNKLAISPFGTPIASRQNQYPYGILAGSGHSILPDQKLARSFSMNKVDLCATHLQVY